MPSGVARNPCGFGSALLPWPRAAWRVRHTAVKKVVRRALLGAALLAVLLDLGLGQVLVLGADHPEDRRRAVAAAGHRTELDGTLAPLATGGSRGATGRRTVATAPAPRADASRHPPAKRRKDCVPRTRQRVLFDQ
jgi:hypothetical protein